MDELELLDKESRDPISDEEAAQLAKDQVERIQHRRVQEGERIEEANIEQEELNQRNLEIDDSRNKENWGIGEYVKEGVSAITGGLQDSVSSLVTLPERVIDFATGEMARENATEEGYKPEWDDWFVNDSDPIETKTWWGTLIRGVTHFGSLAVIPVGQIGVLSKIGLGSKIGGAIGRVLPKLASNKLAIKLGHQALRGAKVDALSVYSQDDNALGVLKEHLGGHVPWVLAPLDPLATNPHDHPMLKTFKNIVEGMGLGVISDTFLESLAKVKNSDLHKLLRGSRSMQELDEGNALLRGTQLQLDELKTLEDQIADNPFRQEWEEARRVLDETTEDLQISSRSNIKPTALARKQLDQDIAANTYQVAYKNYVRWRPDNMDLDQEAIFKRIDEIRAEIDTSSTTYNPYKNEPKARHEGNATSLEHPDDVMESAKQLKNTWGAEDGSLGGVLSKTSIRNAAESAHMAWKEVAKYAEAISKSTKLKKELAVYRSAGRTPDEFYNNQLLVFDKLIKNREISDLSAEEFMKPIYDIVGAMQPYTFTDGTKIQYVAQDFVKSLDLVTGDLLRRLRDSGIMSRELENIINVNGVGGPTDNLIQQLLAVIKMTKLSRMFAGQNLEILGEHGGRTTRQQLLDAVDKQSIENVKALQLATKLAGEGNEELLDGIRHYISMANDVHNVEDLMAFLRAKMRGGELNTKDAGLLIKEMQMVMVNSVLSGPKTGARAIIGTSTATFLRPVAQSLGAALSGDGRVFREGMADLNGMVQAIPESFQLFKRNFKAYWSGDIADIRTRYTERLQSDENWQALAYLTEREGTDSDKIALYLANMARSWNDNSFLTYSTKVMAATDDAFAFILGRGRLRVKAYREVLDNLGESNFKEVTPDMIAMAENKLVDTVFDADNNLKDAFIENARKEVTLTQDLTGWQKDLANVIQKNPWTRPFFLFAKTGVNGLTLTAKHVPIARKLSAEFNAIARATPDNLSKVGKYGIETAADLKAAKAIQRGRLAMGCTAMFLAGQAYLAGNITGNGPVDRVKKQNWINGGWIPRSIKIGDVWVSYDSFEPFNQILAAVADIGDHYELMGDEWAEQNLLSYGLLIGQNIVSKSYLAGLMQLVDLVGGEKNQHEKILASLLNNHLPLSGLRNEIGKVLNPGMKELSKGFWDTLRNRNQFMEILASNPLPIKYDMLDGSPIRDHDFFTRMFNAISPINLNGDWSPGRELLFEGGYDLRTTVFRAPDGTDLSDSPLLRSLFQEAIGQQRIIIQLDQLAEREDIQRSVELMHHDIRNGLRTNDAKSYLHNKLIQEIIDNARKVAWAQIKDHPDAVKLILEARQNTINNLDAYNRSLETLLEIPK